MVKSYYKTIEEILPHRSPMIMIDYYRKIDDDSGYAVKKFESGEYGCHNGSVIDSILIECMAQTVAAYYGYQALEKNGDAPGFGMLVSVDDFVFHCLVQEQSKIEIYVFKIDQIGPFKLFKGKIKIKEKIVAQGQIKIFNPEKEDA